MTKEILVNCINVRGVIRHQASQGYKLLSILVSNPEGWEYAVFVKDPRNWLSRLLKPTPIVSLKDVPYSSFKWAGWEENRRAKVAVEKKRIIEAIIHHTDGSRIEFIHTGSNCVRISVHSDNGGIYSTVVPIVDLVEATEHIAGIEINY